MPVPVPHFTKHPSHQVVKNKQSYPHVADLQSLSNTLPPCPTGPPPSFGTREEWIKSLPAWRRDKPRRIWEDGPCFTDHLSNQGFPRGLTAAGNAPVIKGTPAEACLPPLYSLFGQFASSDATLDEEDDDMGSDCSMDHLDNQSQWTASSPRRDVEDFEITISESQSDNHAPECSGLSPVYDDRSPEEPVSSPLGPITPFGIVVDRAVAEAQVYPSDEDIRPVVVTTQAPVIDGSNDIAHQGFAPWVSTGVGDLLKEPVPTMESATSTISTRYKKLAEPLADWIAEYVWKVCTTGLSLSHPFVVQP